MVLGGGGDKKPTYSHRTQDDPCCSESHHAPFSKTTNQAAARYSGVTCGIAVQDYHLVDRYSSGRRKTDSCYDRRCTTYFSEVFLNLGELKTFLRRQNNRFFAEKKKLLPAG